MSQARNTIRTDAETGLLSAFSAFAGELPAESPFADARRAAIARFAETGLPTRRVESWKYTDLKRLMDEAVPVAEPAPTEAARAAVLAGTALGALERCRLVLVNGRFAAELSDAERLPDGVTIVAVSDALASGEPEWCRAIAAAGEGLDKDAAVQLNTAFLADGVLIDIADGATVDQPIEIEHHFVGDSRGAVTLRNLVTVGARASVDLVESYNGNAAAYQTNALTFIDVGAGGRCGYSRLQTEGHAALHLGTVRARLHADAKLQAFTLMAGADAARAQIFVDCLGEGADADIRGATLGQRRQHADTTLSVDHAVPNCDSREIFKSVVDDEARAVFQGRIVVRPHAQHTDARMMTKALLLSERAEFDTKPELEIFADDVQCAHGATSGALDEDMLFYLMTRGIPRADAEVLLVAAFLGEAIDGIAHNDIADTVRARIEHWLIGRRAQS